MSLKKLSLAAVIVASMTSPIAQADAGLGAGITWVFGQGPAVGVKVFTNDKENKAVGSAGIDYNINSGAWRPNVGIGYLGDDIYGDVNAGYNYKNGAWDVGVGLGATDTQKKTAAPVIVPGPA